MEHIPELPQLLVEVVVPAVAVKTGLQVVLETHLPHLQMEVTERHLHRGRETMVELGLPMEVLMAAVAVVALVLRDQTDHQPLVETAATELHLQFQDHP